jgi:hypothetical protein
VTSTEYFGFSDAKGPLQDATKVIASLLYIKNGGGGEGRGRKKQVSSENFIPDFQKVVSLKRIEVLSGHTRSCVKKKKERKREKKKKRENEK